MAKDTKTYILKKGHQHQGFKDDVRHVFDGNDPDNNKVELNERQAAAFADKFDSAEDLRKKLGDEKARVGEGDDKTAKKPDPSPSVGTAEPAPANVTPAPVGSTPDPVTQAPAKAAESTPAKK